MDRYDEMQRQSAHHRFSDIESRARRLRQDSTALLAHADELIEASRALRNQSYKLRTQIQTSYNSYRHSTHSIPG